jgi:hypothetical protein
MGKEAKRTWDPVLTTATAIVCASIAITTTAFTTSDTDSDGPAATRCTVIDNLTEQTMAHDYVGQSQTVPVQNVGESLVYYDNLYDQQNKVVGHAVGFVSGIYKRPSDGHLMTQYYETVELPDGTFSDNGINDRLAVFDGGTAHFDAIGTAGKYLGWKGTREWQFLPPITRPPRPDARTSVHIELCH